jgi:uncharacterized protein involved in exopolysaccharide biosynthesis
MLESKDFSIFENQLKFDFKGFIIKTAGYWKWFLISWIVAFLIAYNVNIRKEKIYKLETTIALKEENNPFFTSNTSLVFNWGGTSDQVQGLASTFRSRSHNEIVVNNLDFYIDYLSKDKYYMKDVYGDVPFQVVLDKAKPQLLKTLIKIKFINDSQFELSINFESENSELIIYETNFSSKNKNKVGGFKGKFTINQDINLPFLNFKLVKSDFIGDYRGKEYFIKFNNFDETVSKYKEIKIGW